MTLRGELLNRLKRHVEANMGIKLNAFELRILWPVIQPPARKWWQIWRRT